MNDNPLMLKTAIVPVAGLGTRLLPTTQAVPKELLPLGGFPTLHYVAAELAEVGVEKIVLVSSEAKSEIARYFQPNSALIQSLRAKNKTEILEKLWSESKFAELEFEVVIQKEQLGLGHAILCAESAADGQSVIVALGDCVMGYGGKSKILNNMVETYQEKNADIVIAFEQVPDEKVSRYGIAAPKDPTQIEGSFPLADVVEKPSLNDAPSNLAIAARYILPSNIFDCLKKTKSGKDGEIQLTDAIRTLIAEQHSAFGVRFPKGDQRFDVGNMESYTDAFIQFALADPNLHSVAQQAFENFQSKNQNL